METHISTLTTKSQTVIPKAVRAQMGLKPGDHIRYRVRGDKVEIEKLEDETKLNMLSAFTEWASPEDDKAFAYLQDKFNK